MNFSIMVIRSGTEVKLLRLMTWCAMMRKGSRQVTPARCRAGRAGVTTEPAMPLSS
jgi:hypothetical protein